MELISLIGRLRGRKINMVQFGNQNITRISGPVTNINMCPWLKYKIEAKPCIDCIKKYECVVKAERIKINGLENNKPVEHLKKIIPVQKKRGKK